VSQPATAIQRDLAPQQVARPATDHELQQPRSHDPQSARLARPLGVRPELPLTDAQWTALQRLEDYDLAPVRARLLKQELLPAEQVDDAIFEFRRFMGLSILGHPRLPMVSAAVDEVWHTCLLFSRLYMDLCEQTVGKFVHHEPLTGETEDAGDRLDETRKLEHAYTRAYGEMPLWMQPGQQQANGQADELTEADLEGVAGGGAKPGVASGSCSRKCCTNLQ
jgi:hypothetical protein